MIDPPVVTRLASHAEMTRLREVIGDAQRRAWVADAVLHRSVAYWREQGGSWGEVAEATGTTVANARERFDTGHHIA